MTSPLALLGDAFGGLQQAVFERAVQPLGYALGASNLLEEAFEATGWLLVGALEIALIAVVIGALQRWRPLEPVTDRAAVRVDFVYTLLHRLGLFRLVLFFSLGPLWDGLLGWARLQGLPGWHLDAALAPLWPGVSDTAPFAFLAYLVVFDFVDYAIHRGQHRWRWWWQLHALHHSQRQMTMWSDDRNHLLDDLARDTLVVLVAHAIGIAPAQFVAVVVVTQMIESLAHANARLPFGAVLERLIVSPRYHRVHHAIGIGHESAGPRSLGGRNFATLFPVWDIVFGSADFSSAPGPTGVRDQLPESGGRDYGRGFWRQQWLGVRRLVGR